MVNFQNKKIFYTLKEYQNNYNILLKNYLEQHEDFDELMFLEIELQFYNMCYDNSNLILIDIGYGPQYSVNGGHCEILLPEIYDAISLKDGFDLELSTKYNSSFYKILLFLIDKKKQADIVSGNLFSVGKNDLLISDEFNENLSNDPLFNPKNEYNILKSKFKKEYNSKTAHLKTEVDFLLYDLDTDFDEWEKEQKEEINKTFLKLIKELNHKKIFFFGCTFDNYKHNYNKRLNEFLEYYADANEVDFIEDELTFFENILYDLQNPEGADNGFSQSGTDNYSKAYEFVSIVGYKQYFFSHNKKEAFLIKQKQDLINKQEILNKVSVNNHPDEIRLKKRVKFGIKQMIGTLKSSESEQGEIDKQAGKKEDVFQNYNLMPTIEDYLEEFKTDINGDGYEILINALFEYFTNGKFPVLKGKINFKRINKKRVGWALKDLYKSEKTDNLDIEYFRFAQENINLFAKEVIVTEGFNKSNFYKAFTTNPTK